MTSFETKQLREAKPDVAYYTNQIVNLVMISLPDGNWVLIDAGMPKSGEEIMKVAENRFGANKPPLAIILTHGHFDHVGGLVDMVSKWKVPVYAHPLEFPFLTGEAAYPEPDTSVEGGMLAKIAKVYPHEPVNIKAALKEMPSDGSVPFLEDWQWIHVPGHTPGHIALFRPKDHLLICGDAFTTVKQDSLYKVLVQKQEVCGPPVYFTPDWDAAYKSVKKLAALDPDMAITSHGTPMQGESLRDGLRNLVHHWHDVALPSHGKWVTQ